MKGKNDPYISPGLKELFDYIASSRVPGGCKKPLITDMDEALNKARSNEEWRRDFMTLEMMKWDYLEKGREEGLEKGLQQGRKEGREEGREEGLKSGRELEGERYSKLIELLVKDKDYGAFERMTRDETFRKELFEKYRI